MLESEGVSAKASWVQEDDEQICWWFVEDHRVQWYVKAINDLCSPAKSGPDIFKCLQPTRATH